MTNMLLITSLLKKVIKTVQMKITMLPGDKQNLIFF